MSDHPIDRFESASFQAFPRDLMGSEMAHVLSKITMNWGRVEHALYMSMRKIDPKQAPTWTALFFARPMLEDQKKKVRSALASVVGSSSSDLLKHLDHAFNDLKSLQDRRNPLCHGLWLTTTTQNTFEVQPLRYDNGSATFEPSLMVNLPFLCQVFEDMERFINLMYSICAGSMARQQLNKWGI
ncbi:hypothetical protein AB7714_05020 [Tardiphaga sp. 1201_B9_N1_1]